MCTVTYIPATRGAYLTSNRDENTKRRPALPPGQYTCNGCRIIYPRDQEAAGSWIAVKENGDAAVLLNGAFEKHTKQPAYRKSRGLIFLDILNSTDPLHQFSLVNLDHIEPFTLILLCGGQLWECRWDSKDKHRVLLDASHPYIWSSATLYDSDAVKERKRWFLRWFSSISRLNTEKIMEFHLHAGRNDPYNGLVINREDKMQTVSITSVCLLTNKLSMTYKDLQTSSHVVKAFDTILASGKESLGRRIYLYLKKIKIRLLHWEYWPAHLVYGPVYPYWLWLSVKARSFFFFSAANPGIQYAGFIQERKSDIYPLIPQQYYPRTRLFKTGTRTADIVETLKNQGLCFPLIAKPDMGERGKQVKLLHSEDELLIYNGRSKVDFLLQEYINYEQEAGIFYYRIPGETRGYISGIVGKTFLSVTGDGRSSMYELLQQEDRSLLQLSALQYTYGDFLNTVLPPGVKHLLVPYGNHSRGTKFIDLQNKITDKLNHAIDMICRQIPGFYYGRLDIKFNSWEELENGHNFSIIELNGAGSEPTHIYDPGHSLFYAWKEICRHWHLMYRISKLNVAREKLPLMTTGAGIRMIREHRQYSKQIVKV